MSLRPRLRPRQAVRIASFSVEALETRQLLNSDLSLGSAASTAAEVQQLSAARPGAIGRIVAPPPSLTSQVGVSTSGISGFDTPLSASTAPYTPAQIRHAYGVDQLSNNGAGQTIAIIDAYNDTTIQTDLATFDTRFGLPAANLTVAMPGVKPGQTLGSDSNWALETSLDVEWAHAIAPAATILLVEANTPTYSDLLSAVDYAVNLKDSQGVNQVVKQISMSWGGGEFSGESSMFDSYFNHPGVTFLASSGDSGAGVEYPAASPYVTSVGGTSLSIDTSSNRLSETGWSGSGGGISSQVAKPTYQNGFVSGGNRGVPDVSYDADPYTGVYVYDAGSYYQVGGTSAGAPQWAGLIALANQGRAAISLPSLGTGMALGTNTVLYGLAGGTSYTNAGGDFLDITSGSNGTNSNAVAGWDPVTGLGSPVANNLIPALIGQSAPPTTPTVGDSGFETVPVGSGNYSYGPTGSNWTFSGSTGVSGNNSAFTSGNPAAPQGGQVAFLQQTGSFSQSVANWAAGSYQVSLLAAQRANGNSSQENFQVLVDGNVVSSFTPTGSSYQTYTTSPFTVTAGTHSITFKGIDSAGGDNTVFLDTITVAQATAANTPTVGDSGFETVPVGSGNYSYGPTGSNWTFSGSTGVSGNNSAFTSGNPAAPQGGQVAFLQQTGSFSQSVANWAAGSYQVSLLAAQRANGNSSQENFQVLVDGNVVSSFTPTGSSYQTYTTSPFTVTAGTHSITFKGIDSAGGDNTVFLDTITVAQATAANTPTVGDSGFETVPVGSGNYSYGPTGSNWTFSGSTGVSGNNSAFTSGNPAAPQGGQVAFLQQTGSFSQSVANWAAGSYHLSFLAAQRSNQGTVSTEDFQILIDGVSVGTLAPSGTSYQTYTTTSFTVTAGAHSITFQGIDSSKGDNTVFLDNVTVASN